MDNIDDIIGKIKNNSKEENKKLAEELKNNLSASQTEVLQKLFSNKELLNNLLNSDQAKNFMNKINGDKNGHQ